MEVSLQGPRLKPGEPASPKYSADDGRRIEKKVQA